MAHGCTCPEKSDSTVVFIVILPNRPGACASESDDILTSTELDKFANQSCMVNNNTAAFFCGGSASVPRGVVFAPVSLTTVEKPHRKNTRCTSTYSHSMHNIISTCKSEKMQTEASNNDKSTDLN